MTANIRVRASAPALRVAKASPAFRLAMASVDTVQTVYDGLAALDDPNRLLDSVAFLARRENYSEAARRLQKYLIPRVIDDAEYRLVETILNFEVDNICAFRIAHDLKAVSFNSNRALPKFGIRELVALAEGNGKRAKQAWIAVHALGHVRSARGVITIEETTADCPGIWPAAPAEKIALAFNLVVRTVHGARFNSIRLARP